MARERLGQIYHYLCKVAGQENASGLSDGQLVDRFVSQRDEAAFEVLLWRHGTMVLNVCRRVLHREQDAEDAFQATFLTFVRKARVISRREAVAGWLYRVAFRVALTAKARAAKTTCRQEIDLAGVAAFDPEPAWSDLGPVLDAEMSRLPERYRVPIVLCYLEGKTNEEAARELGCPAGTIYSRLARGREMLRRRLARRGLALSTALLTTLITTNAASASLTASLLQTTLKTAMLFATGQAVAGVSARVVTLAEGVLQAMFITKVKVLLAVLVAFGLLIAGAGAMGYLGLSAAEPQDQVPRVEPPPSAGSKPVPEQKKAGPIQVKVVKPSPGGLERTAIVGARVEAYDSVELYSQVAGMLKNQKVDIGDRVKKDQVVAEIDAPLVWKDGEQALLALQSAKDQIQISEALLRAAEAELDGAKKRVTQREAELRSSQAFREFREMTHKRFKELAENKAIDTRLVDEDAEKLAAARGAADGAKAAVEAAGVDVLTRTALVQKARSEVIARQGGVRAAMAAMDKAEIMASFTKIRAPFDGVITQRNFNNGGFIRATDQANPRPLLTLVRTDLMRVVVGIPEIHLPFADKGDPVDLRLRALPKAKFTGLKISRIGYAADATTGSTRVEIDVPNKDNLLRPGMYGDTTIHLEKASAEGMHLPQSCFVGFDGNKADVYVVKNGKAYLTRVETGFGDRGQMEVLSGLNPDDLIVSYPDAAKLRGQVVPVRVQAGK